MRNYHSPLSAPRTVGYSQDVNEPFLDEKQSSKVPGIRQIVNRKAVVRVQKTEIFWEWIQPDSGLVGWMVIRLFNFSLSSQNLFIKRPIIESSDYLRSIRCLSGRVGSPTYFWPITLVGIVFFHLWCRRNNPTGLRTGTDARERRP